MCTKSFRLALPAIAVLAMLSQPLPAAGSDRWGSLSAGGIFSPKGVGASASFQHKDGSFTAVSANIDLTDIPGGTEVLPGLKVSLHYNLPLLEKDLNGFPCNIYAGPGAVMGYVHDKGSTNRGFMAGVSGAAGVRFAMWHNFELALEWQADLAFILEGESTVSFYKSGCVFSYYPHLKIQYEF